MRVDLFEFMRPRLLVDSGGGGGGNGRIAPQAGDLVWYDFAGNTWVGSEGAAGHDLAVAGSAPAYQSAGVYGDGVMCPLPLDSTTQGGLARSLAGTTLGQWSVWTWVCWFDLRAVPVNALAHGIVVKQSNTGGWAPPYADAGIYLLGDQTLVLSVTTSGGNYTAQTDDPIPVGRHLIAACCDGSKIWIHVDEADASPREDLPLSIAWLGGPWVLGGLPVGAGVAYSSGHISDVRICHRVLSTAELATMFATRRTP